MYCFMPAGQCLHVSWGCFCHSELFTYWSDGLSFTPNDWNEPYHMRDHRSLITCVVAGEVANYCKFCGCQWCTVYDLLQILWMIPVNWLQWVLVLAGMALSGSVLVLSIIPAFKEDKKAVGFILVLTASPVFNLFILDIQPLDML